MEVERLALFLLVTGAEDHSRLCDQAGPISQDVEPIFDCLNIIQNDP
jgi:hypothetical protein